MSVKAEALIQNALSPGVEIIVAPLLGLMSKLQQVENELRVEKKKKKRKGSGTFPLAYY